MFKDDKSDKIQVNVRKAAYKDKHYKIIAKVILEIRQKIVIIVIYDCNDRCLANFNCDIR